MMSEEIKKRILVVEDDLALAQVLADTLKIAQFDIALAMDGSDAMNRLKTEKYDIVLLDLLMPNVDGFGVLSELKSNQANPPPVIVMSSLADLDSINKARALGAVDYLVKSSMTPDLIIRQVQKYLK